MINRYTFAGLFSVLAVIGLTALGFAVFGGSDERTADPAASDVTTPTPTATADPLAAAAKAAGCTLLSPANEGAAHADRAFTAADYASNPPTSGTHAPEWAPDHVYRPGNTPELGTLVHTLEHGRINLQYRPGTPARTIQELVRFYESFENGYHLLVYENQTRMPYAVAATAWDQLIGCPEMNANVIAALREFTKAYVDKGPERVP